MPKVASDDLKAFGMAVQRARSLKGWTLKELGAQIEPPVGNSLVSKVERGRKEALNSLTVGRFIKALDLDESWIDRFLHADTFNDEIEARQEREADLIFDRAKRENITEGASDELLIQLANTYAEGTHKDRESAYIGVKKALEAFAEMKLRGAAKDNANTDFHLVMAEVTKLNDAGEVDEADAVLEAEERRLYEARSVEIDRLNQKAETILAQRIDQDRIRNRPNLTADRIIRNKRLSPQAGGLFWAIDQEALDWNSSGDQSNDFFKVRVAVALAKANYERSKNKSGRAARALSTFGWCNFDLAERSVSDQNFVLCRTAFENSIKKTSKTKDPLVWASRQSGLGTTLMRIGERHADSTVLRLSGKVLKQALDVVCSEKSGDQSKYWINLGRAYSILGQVERDPVISRKAVEALETAASMDLTSEDFFIWDQNNLAVAKKRLGEIVGDLGILRDARKIYADIESFDGREQFPFRLAVLRWNIADLALCRYRLAADPALIAEANEYVRAAREIFVDGSDYQTQLCDELLDQIERLQRA